MPYFTSFLIEKIVYDLIENQTLLNYKELFLAFLHLKTIISHMQLFKFYIDI